MSDTDFTDHFTASLLNLDSTMVRDLLENPDSFTQQQLPIPDPGSFQLRKARWNGETKWIKIPVQNDKPVQYEDFLRAARNAFGLDGSEDVVLRDEEDAIIEPEIFLLFPNTTFRITPIATEAPSSGSTTDTVSVSGNSLASATSTSSDRTTSGPQKRKFVDDLDLIEEIRSVSGGSEILTEYELHKGLAGTSRKKLVNIVVNLMVNNEGHRPTKEAKIFYAKQIVAAFPNLKDPATEEGYELFYDPVGRSGYISWRLRTLNRRSSSGESTQVAVKIHDKENKKPPLNLPLHDEERAQAQLIFLRNACSKTQKNEILLALQDTFHLRRSAPGKILDDFPRFFDAPYLINADFELMQPGVGITEFSAERILLAYMKYSGNTCTAKKAKIDTDQEPDWDKVTSAYITLLKLIPPTAKGRKKADRIGVISAIDRLILFHKTGTPLETAPVQTTQPCLLAVGPNRAAVSSYFIAVDKKILPIDATDSSAAFDTLFKSHFVLDTKFDASLSMFYEFIQVFYYKMDSATRFTARMREVRNWLSQV